MLTANAVDLTLAFLENMSDTCKIEVGLNLVFFDFVGSFDTGAAIIFQALFLVEVVMQIGPRLNALF